VNDYTKEAIAAALFAVAGFVARMALRFLRSREGRAIIMAVGRASVHAAAAAESRLRRGIEAARQPDSDGGAKVTRAEWDAAVRGAVEDAMAHLDLLGILDAAIAAAGGRDKLVDQLAGKVEAELSKRGLTQ